MYRAKAAGPGRCDYAGLAHHRSASPTGGAHTANSGSPRGRRSAPFDRRVPKPPASGSSARRSRSAARRRREPAADRLGREAAVGERGDERGVRPQRPRDVGEHLDRPDQVVDRHAADRASNDRRRTAARVGVEVVHDRAGPAGWPRARGVHAEHGEAAGGSRKCETHEPMRSSTVPVMPSSA